MDYIRVIPSLLLLNKKLVKGVCFKNFKNAGSPLSTITAFDSQGADEILIMDINTYLDKKKEPDYEIIKKISGISSTPITFGGGIRNIEIAKKIIRFGIEKIYLNRIVFENKNIVTQLIKYLGGQALVIGVNLIKIQGKYRIYEDKENKIDVLKYIIDIQNMGIGEIKITFVDREGKKCGLDNKFCKYIMSYIWVSSIFEGGIGSLEHLEDAFKEKIGAIALGTMLTFNDYNIVKIKRHLYNKGFNVRL